MGIAKLKPDADPGINLHNTKVPKENYKGILADADTTPTMSLQAYIDGMPWNVSYFRQLLGEHNDLRPLDSASHDAAQQYEKFGELELKVASALTNSYDTTTAKNTVTGSAIIPIITPNVHDYFISDAGSRQYGIYRVTNVERRTFNRDSVHLIDYQLIGYVNSESESYRALEARAVRQFRFSKKRLVEGLSPILRIEEYEMLSDFHRHYGDMVADYMRDFFNRSYMTLVVPGQDKSVYDAWITDFMIKLVEPTDAPEVRQMRCLTLEHDRYLAQGGLWKVLMERQHGMLARVNQKTHQVPRTAFHTTSFLKGSSYWPMTHYVYPKHPDMTSQVSGYPRPKDSDFTVLINKELPDGVFPTHLDNHTLVDDEAVDIIKPVLVDDFYVLSREFYEGGDNLSVLEILTKDYLKCQTLNFNLLSALVVNYHRWPALERFYYGPIVMLLLKAAVEGLYL